jgi:hypothetical protein
MGRAGRTIDETPRARDAASGVFLYPPGAIHEGPPVKTRERIFVHGFKQDYRRLLKMN